MVADAVGGAGRVEAFAEHQPAGLLQPQPLLELQRAHSGDGFEVVMEPRNAHPQLARDAVDAQGLVKVCMQALDGLDDGERSLPRKISLLPWAITQKDGSTTLCSDSLVDEERRSSRPFSGSTVPSARTAPATSLTSRSRLSWSRWPTCATGWEIIQSPLNASFSSLAESYNDLRESLYQAALQGAKIYSLEDRSSENAKAQTWKKQFGR